MLKYSIGQMLTSRHMEWVVLGTIVVAYSMLFSSYVREVAGW